MYCDIVQGAADLSFMRVPYACSAFKCSVSKQHVCPFWLQGAIEVDPLQPKIGIDRPRKTWFHFEEILKLKGLAHECDSF